MSAAGSHRAARLFPVVPDPGCSIMRIINDTPFKLISQGALIGSRDTMAVIVKGTFKLVQDGPCETAAEQRDLSPDMPYMDEIGRSLAWANDLVPFKPHTDFCVHGACHAPGGQAVEWGTAGFELGPLRKEIVFRGPRAARRRADGSYEVSAAKPVRSVPLRWEYALGGLRDPANPMGRGREVGQDAGAVIQLPLLEYPDQPWRSPRDKGKPANLAPVPPVFMERRRKNGTRDQQWATFRAPLPPLDYDLSINNAAPEDQQAGNYPLGNEPLVLRNLHPKTAVLITLLPGLRLRVGMLRRSGGDVAPEEVPMVIDTIVALPEEDQLVMVWRGSVKKTAGLKQPEFVWLHCFAEPLGDPPRDFAEVGAAMLAQFRKEQPPSEADYDKAIARMLGVMREKAAKANLPAGLLKVLNTENDPMKLMGAINGHLEELARGFEQRTKSGPKE